MSRMDFFWKRQRGACWLMLAPDCRDVNGFMDVRAKDSPRRATWDHIVPVSKRGKDPYNVLLACSECNGRRGTTPAPTEAVDRAKLIWQEWEAHCIATAQPPKAKRAKKAKEPGSIAMARVTRATLDLEDDIGRREAERIARNTAFMYPNKRSA